jgi:hypothetical protein
VDIANSWELLVFASFLPDDSCNLIMGPEIRSAAELSEPKYNNFNMIEHQFVVHNYVVTS